eukprot:3935581-Rhodomonas_salina.1
MAWTQATLLAPRGGLQAHGAACEAEGSEAEGSEGVNGRLSWELVPLSEGRAAPKGARDRVTCPLVLLGAPKATHRETAESNAFMVQSVRRWWLFVFDFAAACSA